jgi:hypothetical protein
MNADGSSLHTLVDKWLAPSTRMPAHVVRFSRMAAQRRRYVCVEVAHPGGPIAIFFFRHDDGAWRVFPPADLRPAMTMRAA